MDELEKHYLDTLPSKCHLKYGYVSNLQPFLKQKEINLRHHLNTLALDPKEPKRLDAKLKKPKERKPK